MKVIFLDFDGVLNNENTSEYFNMFSHTNFVNLKKIIDTTNSYMFNYIS
jgi:histidinol phosphatase-like enzyme